MISKIYSGAIHGVDGYIVTVEVDIAQGLPAFDIVGLPDSAVKESKERVRVAIKNSGSQFPIRRVTVNMAPADTKKEGASFDLPIAAGILAGIGIIPRESAENCFIVGELSLDGQVRPVSGILPMVYGAKQSGIRCCIVPADNGTEAALVEGIDVICVRSLSELIGHFDNKPVAPLQIDRSSVFDSNHCGAVLDFLDVKGQENVKRALEICAAGRHNLLMIGPPGSGKTMMAKRLPGILPALSFDESLEITKIYSVAGLLKDKSSLVNARPFRSPHHTISYSALTGGGRIPKPGEISLAHNGVLFLDELTEFHRNVLEVMRQPLEDGFVHISRVNAAVTYPAKFMLIASMNPCPCGHYGNSSKCTCSQNEISKYLGKISGPLLDRIDIQVEAAAVNYEDFHNTADDYSTEKIRERIVRVHDIQKSRYSAEGIRFNSELSSSLIEQHCSLGKAEQSMLKRAFDNLNLSARAYHKVLKVSRTIADLENSEEINVRHLAEAIQYRSLDRKYWG